jgi:hypothetical protein
MTEDERATLRASARARRVVRFLTDDAAGLWRKGELAEDLGWESDHPDAPPIRLLRLRGEVICLTDPFERGLCEEIT